MIQDWRTGRGADAGLHERARRSRARARPASCTSGAARAASCGTRARRRATRRRVRALRLDCDGDAVLALVEPAGPACHTGERTCFHRGDMEPPRRTRRCPRSSARSRARRRAPRGLLHRRSCSTTRRCIGEKVEEEAEEVARAAARRPTSASTRRRPTSSPPHRAAARPRAHARATPRRCSMAVAAEQRAGRCRRADAGGGPGARRATTTSIPLRHTFIDDRETPVSRVPEAARRDRVPAFLLESAEQGQRVGRCSFIGVRPRKVVRWSLGDGGDPYALAAEEVARARQAPLPGRPAVHRRRRRLLRLRPRADGRAARRAQPRRPRPARHGADALRRARGLRPPQAHGDRSSPTSTPTTATRRVLRRRRGDDRRGARAARRARARPPAGAARARRPEFTSNMPREQFEGMVARIVEYVHAGDAFQVVPSQRWRRRCRWTPFSIYRGLRVGQPVAVHVLPGLRGLPDRRRLARAAADRRRPHASRRGRSPARARAAATSRRTTRIAGSCSPTRRSAPST